MKKFLVLVFAITLLIPFVTSAEPVEVSVSPAELVTYPNHAAYYNLFITNNLEQKTGFTITISGRRAYWASPPDIYAQIDPYYSKTYTLNFYPTGLDRGVFNYKITVTPDDGETIDSTDLKLTVLEPVVVRDFKPEFQDYKLMLNGIVDSINMQDLQAVFTVIDTDGKEITSLSMEMKDALGPIPFSKSLSLARNLPADQYIVKTQVFGKSIVDYSSESAFEVPAIHNVVENVKKESAPLYDFYTVTFRNDGNVVEDYVTYREVSSDLITGFLTSPQECKVEGGKRRCAYLVSDLNVGETKQISYRVEYWPVLIPYIIIGIIAVTVAATGFRQVTKPSINKRYIRKSGNVHSIVLNVKNPFYYNLESVIVRDWVSPLASVLSEGFESVRPVIKSSDAGTELIWNLGNVKPNEERIITYKIRPIVEGSGLKMPSASARYTDNKGRVGRINSGELLLVE